jgi:hypothetical protein
MDPYIISTLQSLHARLTRLESQTHLEGREIHSMSLIEQMDRLDALFQYISSENDRTHRIIQATPPSHSFPEIESSYGTQRAAIKINVPAELNEEIQSIHILNPTGFLYIIRVKSSPAAHALPIRTELFKRPQHVVDYLRRLLRI